MKSIEEKCRELPIEEIIEIEGTVKISSDGEFIIIENDKTINLIN
jgi:hypothetical protein